jgi:hypothetical protein
MHTPGLIWLRKQLSNPNPWRGTITGDGRSFVQATTAGRTAGKGMHGLHQLKERAHWSRTVPGGEAGAVAVVKGMGRTHC